MGLLRKAVRRATPRPVRQVKRVVTHPVRTSVRAVTPRPIRNVQRSVFNATHPVNTLENALLNSLTGTPRRHRASRGRASMPASSYYRSTGPGSNAAAYERAVLAEQIHQAEAELFSRHLGEFKPFAIVNIPAVQEPDPRPARVRLEAQLGNSELRAELPSLLAPYGVPPIAPDPPSVDADAIERELFRHAVAGVSWTRRRERRTIREQARVDAEQQLRDQNEQNLLEQRRLQEALNEKQARLDALERSLTEQLRVWVEAQVAEGEQTADCGCCGCGGSRRSTPCKRSGHRLRRTQGRACE